MFKKYCVSLVLEAVHVQQPEPIVEKLACLLSFPILAQIRFGLKRNHDRLFGDFVNSSYTDFRCTFV